MPMTPGSTGRAVDAVVVEEGLSGGVQRGAHHQAVVDAGADDFAEHRPSHRQRARVDSAGVVELAGHRAQRTGDDDLAVWKCRWSAHAGSRPRPPRAGSISTPAAAMIFGIDPRVAMPMPPHAVQSIASARVSGRVRRKLLSELAQQVVGGAVVGLPDVAEPPGHRAERHDRRRSASFRRRAAG